MFAKKRQLAKMFEKGSVFSVEKCGGIMYDNEQEKLMHNREKKCMEIVLKKERHL